MLVSGDQEVPRVPEVALEVAGWNGPSVPYLTGWMLIQLVEAQALQTCLWILASVLVISAQAREAETGGSL